MDKKELIKKATEQEEQKIESVEAPDQTSQNENGEDLNEIYNPEFKPGEIADRSIIDEMKSNYLDYSMSVIVSRALPEVRDGLKPSQRRILVAMNDLNLTPSAHYRKSAKIAGDTSGNYHPHGEAIVYPTMVKLAQEFSTRYVLVDGQGNFGCFTIDTKVKLVDGRSLTFAQLIDEDKQGKKNYTYTINAKGRVEIGLIHKPRLTIKEAEIMTVVLDNGKEIRCTLNHRFLLKNGKYVEAQHLKPGTSLMPLYERASTQKDYPLRDMKGYTMVLNPLDKSWSFVHHLADKFNIDSKQYSVKDGKVRHHKDFNKANNSPDNIVRMDWKEHWNLHSNLTKFRHQTDEAYVESDLNKGTTFLVTF